MAANTYKKAARYYARKKYADVIRLLEPQVFRYRDDHNFYYLLGSSCLHTGDFGGAFSYLKRCLSLKPLDENTLLSLAVVHLKREETAEAIRNWFSVLDENTNNKIAARGLKITKKQNPDTFNNLFVTGRYQKLLPKQKRSIMPFIVLFFVLAGVVAGSGLLVKYMINNNKSVREVGTDFSLNTDQLLTVDTSEALYVLTENQIDDIYRNAYRKFQNFEDNAARLDLNKIILSNAAAPVKLNADKMISFLRTPTLVSLDTNYSYYEVLEDPFLYNKCFIVWKGMVSNLVLENEELFFDFLVGYHNQQELLGTVSCRYGVSSLSSTIRNGDSAEILAQIIPAGESFILEVRSYHKILPEN